MNQQIVISVWRGVVDRVWTTDGRKPTTGIRVEVLDQDGDNPAAIKARRKIERVERSAKFAQVWP